MRGTNNALNTSCVAHDFLVEKENINLQKKNIFRIEYRFAQNHRK